MAIIEQGILGGFRGKCGNVIGYFRNGVACIRSMPVHYHDRRSEAQLRNRNRFSMVMKMMSVVRPAVSLGFKRFASAMTEMNVATRVNYYSLVKDGAAGLCYDYSGLVLCRGRVEELSGLMMSAVGNSLDFVWNGHDVLGGGDDEVSMVLLNCDRMEMKFCKGVAVRCDGGISITIPQNWNGDEIHCYAMVSRGEDWSESRYVGRISNGNVLTLCVLDGEMENSGVDAGENMLFSSLDQSAIKVLSNLDQNGVSEGESWTKIRTRRKKGD